MLKISSADTNNGIPRANNGDEPAVVAARYQNHLGTMQTTLLLVNVSKKFTRRLRGCPSAVSEHHRYVAATVLN